jgi:acetylornithine deacetylase
MEEKLVADMIMSQLEEYGLKPGRKLNNVWARIDTGDRLPTILLNSHLDTVKPVKGWQTDPFHPEIHENRIYGLGSNDAGASLVSLLATFVYLAGLDKLPFNLIFAATAEEEITGQNGISSIIKELGPVDFGIIGEPTGMRLAIAEKGLMVIDCTAFGRSSHVSHQPADNAIYNAIRDITWIRNHPFEKKSALLADVQMQVTEISAGYQHNIVPDQCRFTIDIRSNDRYSNKEIYEVLKDNLSSTIIPRSLRLNSSSIPLNHPVVKKAVSMGIEYFGSSTLSDQSVLSFPTVKIGPGDSARSHTANEFIKVEEISEGIDIYIRLLTGLKINRNSGN